MAALLPDVRTPDLMKYNMNWRHILTICFVLATSACPTVGQSGIPGDTIIIGTVYNIFHEEFPTDEAFFRQVDRDIPAIAAAHFNYVMIFPMSEWDVSTRELRWVRTDYLVKKIEEYHLKFVPLLLKEEQCSYYFPIWKFKELGLWDERNVNNGNPNNRENVDFADPKVFPLVEQYVKAVAMRYGPSPALGFYNLWNEPHYNSAAPHVIERFRDWLKKKYGSLAALRRAWGDDYTDWSQVSPFLNDDWNSSMPGIDWTLFRNELDGTLLGELASVLRKYDSTHAINANPVGTPFAIFAPFAAYNTDNWQFTAHNDFNGASYYPDAWVREHGLNRAPLWFHNLNFDIFRSAARDKDYILTEIYTNAKTGLTLGGYLDADTAEQLAWIALANDCKGLIYWKWEPFHRGRQSLGRGLVGLDGELAPRGRAISDFAAVMKKHGPLLRQARLTPAEVGVVVDMVGLLKVLQQPAEPRTQTFMYRDIAGTIRALDSANISVDVLRADLGLDRTQLSRYKVLILPFQVVVRRELGALLQDFVRQGGCLIADARTATLDELDYAYPQNPGAGLAELFGAERKDWIAEPTKFPVHVDAPGWWTGNFEGVNFREQLRVAADAKVLGTFPDTGEPALVSHRSGKGTTLLSAVPLGASATERPEDPVNALLVHACLQAGVAPAGRFISAVNPTTSPMIRVHRLGGERVIYVINSTDESISGRVEIARPDGSSTLAAQDLVSGNSLALVNDGLTVEIPVTLAKQRVMIIHVGP